MRRVLLGLVCLLALLTTRVEAAVRLQVQESSSEQLRLVVEISGAGLVPVSTPDAEYQRVRIPGFLDGGEPGLPMVPTAGRWIVLPPSGQPTLRARVVQRQDLGTARLMPHPTGRRVRTAEYGVPELVEVVEESADYVRFRRDESDVVRLGTPVWMRRQRMAALTIDPLIHDAATGRVSIATEIEITVSFPVRAKTVVPEPGAVDHVVLRSVVNPEMASAWRTLAPGHQVRRDRWEASVSERMFPRGKTQALVSGVTPLDPALLRGDQARIRVDRTGLTRVKMSELIDDHGFPPDVPRRFVRLYQMRYNPDDPGRPLTADVPIVFFGNPDPNGVISASDEIIFYGFDAEDDAEARSVDGDDFPAAMQNRPDNYNSFNVYWCAAADPGEGAWARMAAITLPAAQGPLQPSFRRVDEFKGDVGYQQNPKTLREPRYHWNTGGEKEVIKSVEVKHPLAGSDLDITWTVVRMANVSVPLEIEFSAQKDGETVAVLDTLNMRLNDYDVLRAESATIDADLVGDGFLDFRMANAQTDVIVVSALGSIRLEYDALYRASANQAFFDTGQDGGEVHLEVTGFTSSSLLAFELTDPHEPRVIMLGAENVIEREGLRVLRLRVAQQAGERRAFGALPITRITKVLSENLERDSVVDVIEATGRTQALAVGPALLESAVQPWLTWRESHDLFDWNYAFVDVQQIYDQFSGGLKAPVGIKRFAEYAYTMWEARALVLVGDANENTREIGETTVPDHVPPSLHIQIYDDTELLASDKWYGLFCTDVDGNIVDCTGYPGSLVKGPDMLVGRLPANDPAELATMVEKIILYEQPAAEDAWRARTLWVADDAWSTSYGGDDPCYQERTSESGFVDGQRANADTVSVSLDQVVEGVLWDLDEQIEEAWRIPVVCQGGRTGANRSAVSQQVANVVLPRFVDLLSEGWLMVSYQGHAAFNVLTHEGLFQRDTVNQLRNQGRPFLFFGMGCHVSDFLQHQEGIKGKSIGEQLVTLPGSGAIATYGSSGFEFLTPNRNFMDVINDNFFTRLEDNTGGTVTPGVPPRPPISSDPLRSYWVLGEQLAQSEMEILGTSTSSKEEMMAQYNLLGDPLLRMDGAPPRLIVEADGAPVDDGALLIPGAGTAQVQFALQAIDHSGIDRLEVTDDQGRDYGELLQYAPAEDARDQQATATLPIYPQGYTVEIRAYDGSYPDVRPTLIRLVVPFDLVVRVDLDQDGTPEEVEENEGGLRRGQRSPLELEFESAIALAEEDIEVTMDGARLASVEVTSLGPDGRRWLATTEIVEVEDESTQIVRLQLQGVETPFTLIDATAPGDGDLALRSHFPFPNPARGPVRFVAESTRAVDEVRLTVYDLTGRPIQDLKAGAGDPHLEVQEDRFSLEWDGRDGRGDELANGVYMYRLEARASGAQSARSSMGRVVFMR